MTLVSPPAPATTGTGGAFRRLVAGTLAVALGAGAMVLVSATTATAATSYGVIATVPTGPGLGDGMGIDTANGSLYVSRSGADVVSVVDLATNTVEATIEVPGPGRIAVDPAAHRAYVVRSGSALAVIDTTTNTVVDTIGGFSNPIGVAVDPGTHTVYVTNYDSQVVSVLDTTTSPASRRDTDIVGSRPWAIAVDTTTHKAYAATLFGGSLAVVSGTNVTNSVYGFAGPIQVAVDPVGHRAYVVNNNAEGVSMVDTTTEVNLGTFSAGSGPSDMAVDPATATGFVTNRNDDTVSVIDLTDHSVLGSVAVGDHPVSVEVDPVTHRAYVANDDDTLSVISLPTAQRTATWTGASSSSFSDRGNWDGPGPVPGDALVFPAGAVRTSVVNGRAAGTSYASLTIADAGYTISGNALDVAGPVSATPGSGTSTISAPLSLGTGAVSVASGGTLSLTGGVSGDSGLAFTGGGTLRLASVGSYTGTTEVGSGVLAVDGSIVSPVLLAGGTLTGSGALRGAGITASSPSTISPGTASGPGLLTYASASGLTLPSSSTLHIDLDGTTPGTGHDRLALNSGSALFNPNGATLDVDLGHLPTVNSSYQIVSQSFGLPITGRFNGIPQFGTLTEGPVTFSVGYFNSGVVLTVTDVRTPSVSVADSSLRAGETTPVTITFTEPVSGFTNDDLTVANGTLSAVGSTDGGTTWTATLTPAASVTDSTNRIVLDDTGVRYGDGRAGLGSVESNNYAVDTDRPTATVVVADDDLRLGETSLVTFTFTEPVSGLSDDDLTVANGTLDAPSSADGGTTWTATLTPDAGVRDSTNRIVLDTTGVVDAAGNTGTGTTDSNSYAVHTTRPTATIALADTALRAGETTTVTISFSEPVTGFTIADLTVANGTLSALSSADGGTTWTATLTPDAAVTDATNVIALDNSGVVNAAGTSGTGVTESDSYAVDTTRPTATITVEDTALRAGDTSPVTITFSEPVTGFSNADLTVANGTLSAVGSADGGTTWTATLTPDSPVTDSTNRITLDTTGVVDLAGNAGVGTTDSDSYAVDTASPTATVVVADDDLRLGETSLVTFTFTEPVIELDDADLTVPNGTLSTVGSTDDGTTWTAMLTPDAGVRDSTNVIILDTTGVTDAAGNTGVGTTASGNYAVDTIVPPTIPAPVPTVTTPVATDTAGPRSALLGPRHSADRSWTVRYTASDAGSGVASVDLYVRAPGEATYAKAATDAATQDGVFEYTGARQGRYRFYTVATDRAGNREATPAAVVTTTLDTRRPVVRLRMKDGPATLVLGDHRAIALRFHVSEAVRTTMRISRAGTTVRTFRERMSSRGVLERLWYGWDDDGARVRPARYRVVLIARDAAGNRTREVAHVRVTR